MKKLFALLLAGLAVLCLRAQSIQKLEYFFDSDPGAGNGTLITLTASSDTVITTVSVSTTGLTPGMHQLVIRAKDANGVWSLYEVRPVLVALPNIIPAQPAIKGIEAFVDVDPGVGNGSYFNLTPQDTQVVTLNLSGLTTNLAPGHHWLYLRAVDSWGRTGLYEARPFYIPDAPAPQNLPLLTSVEYFIDTDPGVGNATQIAFAAADSIHDTLSLPTTGLTAGTHYIYARVFNAQNGVSFTARDTFLITNCVPLVIDVDLGTQDGTTVCAGNSITFIAYPTAPPSATLKWFKNGQEIAGAINDTLVFANPVHGDSVWAVVTAWDSCTSAWVHDTSQTLTITVLQNVSPGVTAAALNTTVCAGDTALVYVSATVNDGGAPGFQWYKNGQFLLGENNDSLRFVPLANDSVWVQMASIAQCASPAVVQSNSVHFQLSTPLQPTLTIGVADSGYVSGSIGIYVAGYTYGGLNPVIHIVNSNNPQQHYLPYSLTDTMFFTQLDINDSIYGILYPQLSCTAADSVFSNTVKLLPKPINIPPLVLEPADTTLCKPGYHNLSVALPGLFINSPDVVEARAVWQMDSVYSLSYGVNYPLSQQLHDSIFYTIVASPFVPKPIDSARVYIYVDYYNAPNDTFYSNWAKFQFEVPQVTQTVTQTTFCLLDTLVMSHQFNDVASQQGYDVLFWKGGLNGLQTCQNCTNTTVPFVMNDPLFGVPDSIQMRFYITNNCGQSDTLLTPVLQLNQSGNASLPTFSVTYSATQLCPGDTLIITPTVANADTLLGIDVSIKTLQNQMLAFNFPAINNQLPATVPLVMQANYDSVWVSFTGKNGCNKTYQLQTPVQNVTVVGNLVPQLLISAQDTTICPPFNAAYFTSSATNMGTSSSIHWYKNGQSLGGWSVGGTKSISISNTIDTIQAMMVSNNPCAAFDTVWSNIVYIYSFDPKPLEVKVNGRLVTPISIYRTCSNVNSLAIACNYDSVVYSAPPPGFIGYFPGADSLYPPLAHPLTYFAITATAYDKAGCSRSMTFNMRVDPAPYKPIINLNANGWLAGGLITTGAQYQWFDANMDTIAGADSTWYYPQANGAYYLMAYRYTDSCYSLSDPFVFTVFGEEENSSGDGLTLYPNPAHDWVRIALPTADAQRIEIYGVAGSLLMQTDISSNVSEVELDTRDLPAGIYLLKVRFKTGQQTVKQLIVRK